ncbi:MAG: flagellar hook-associated protein FlgK [Lachnospiraceae bacterium]|nr:flagellar hook-associated protein FlgK [Lachnospiraceae bacterium]
MGTSQFFGLNIAGSALAAFQSSVNTTANNISNVQTKGYSKQVTTLETSEALRVNAKYGTTGTGVAAIAVTQLRDFYYDTKYWNNNAGLGLYETRLYYMEQMQMYLRDDDTEQGFATLLKTMFNDMDSLKGHTGDENYRKQFIGSAQSLAVYFNGMSSSLSDLQLTINSEVKATVDSINAISQKIALINKQINQIEVRGGYANELRDERALLVDQLSVMAPVEVSETPITNSNYPDMYLGMNNYSVKIAGQSLVNGNDYRTLTCTPRTQKVNQTDIEGLYEVTWSDTGMKFNATSGSMSGTLKALFEMRDGNNGENFRGKIGTEAGSIQDVQVNGRPVTQITVKDPSITEIQKLTIAEEGLLTIRDDDYEYSDFTVNDDGSYTFTLKMQLNSVQKSKFLGENVAIGKSIEAMGIPYYQAQMNEFLRNFAKGFNDIQRGDPADPGVDADGNPMGSFFVGKRATGGEYDFTDTNLTSTSNTYYQLTAANITVAAETLNNPRRLAAVTESEYTDGTDKYTLIEESLKMESKTTMYRGGGSDDFLQCLLSDVAVDTQESKLFYQNYSNIEMSINLQRQSISGVDEDEEALELVKFQNAYNLASKMISVMAEMYDRLILETGV